MDNKLKILSEELLLTKIFQSRTACPLMRIQSMTCMIFEKRKRFQELNPKRS